MNGKFFLLGVMMLFVAGAPTSAVEAPAAKVATTPKQISASRTGNPAGKIEKALQQARLWDEKEDEAAEKIVGYFYLKATEERDALLSAVFYSLTAQTLWEYYKSYGAVEGFREERQETAQARGFESLDTWTKRDFYQAVSEFLEKSCALSIDEHDAETLAFFEPVLRLWDSTLAAYTPDLTMVLHYRALQLWHEIDRDAAGTFVEAREQAGRAAARCRARLEASDNGREALCDWDIRYLRFLYESDSIDRNNYIKRLLHLSETYEDLPLAGDIFYLVAENTQDPAQALEYAGRAVACPKGWGAHNGRILEHDLRTPSLSLSTKRVPAPNEPVEVNFEARNCRTLAYTLRRLTAKEREDALTSGFSEDFSGKLVEEAPQWNRVELHPDTSGRGSFFLPVLEKGAYALACRFDSAKTSNAKVSDAKNVAFLLLQVSDGAYFVYPSGKRREAWDALFMAGKDGRGVPASLSVFSEKYNYRQRRNDFEFRRCLKSDKNGIFTLDGSLLDNKKTGEAFWLRFERGDDTLWVENPVYVAAEAEPGRTRSQKKMGDIRFFPDLPLYRKGDSVHMAVWVSDTPSLVHFSLRDPEKNIRLSLDGKPQNGLIRLDFALPGEGKAGSWQLSAQDYSTRFHLGVEEYVRPTFEMLWENVPLQAEDDSFHMEGKAAYLSGENLQQARVDYTVFKCAYTYVRPFTLYGFRIPARRKTAEILLSKGSVRTDADGRFSFRFAQDTASTGNATFWSYEVVCEGVDAGGETQTLHAEIPLKILYSLEVEGEDLWVLDKGEWIGNPRPLEVHMNGINPGEKWELLDSTLLFPRPDWASGEHELRFSAVAPDGKTLHATKKIRVEKCGETATDFFLKADGVHESLARFAVGNASSSSLPFRFRMEDAYGNFISKEILLQEGCHRVEFLCPGLNPQSDWTLSLLAMHNGKAVNEECTLTPPRPERKMNFSMRRAGSGVNPSRAGQNDTLFFESPSKNTANAEPQALIVSMHDQSLEAFPQSDSRWPSSLSAPYPKAPASPWNGALCSDRPAWLFLHGPSHPDSYLPYPALPADLAWNGLTRYQSSLHFLGSRPLRIRGTGAVPRMTMAKNADATEETAPEKEIQDGNTAEGLTVREDFSPGIFFALPTWQATDSGYKAVLPFTHPAYFGRFKIRAFGFDHRLYANYLEQTVQVSNPLMLYPQTPRFLTVDDNAVLSCRFVTETSGNLYVQLTATAIDQDGARHTLASSCHNQDQALQGAFELPLRIEKTYTKIEFLCTATLTFGQDSTQVSDRVKKEIPVTAERIKLCEYYPFALLPEKKNELKPNFTFPCDSLHLTLNAPSESLAVSLLADREFDSCKTSLQTAEKIAVLCLTQKPWKHLWPLLQEFSKPDGGCGWLRKSDVSVDVTLSVLETLASVPEKELSSLRDGRKWVKNNLDYLEKKFRSSADTNALQPSPSEIRFLKVCARWKCDADFLPLRNTDKLSLEQRAVLLSYFLSRKRYDEAWGILADLRRLALYDPVQGMYWKREALGGNPGRRMQTMSAIAGSFSYAASLEDFASQTGRDSLYSQYLQILAWFPAQKQSLDFARPNGNGVGTRELLAWASASRATAPTTRQNTRQAANKPQALDTLIPVKELNNFVARLPLSETDNTTAPSVRFGTLRACVTQKTHEVKAYKGNGDLVVSLTYAPPALGNAYRRGEIVEVAAEIKARRDFNYVHLKLPRPAGLEWEDTRSGFTSQKRIRFYRDVDVCNTDCFIDFLPKGTYRIFYRLKAQNAGEYTQQPASAASENESAFGSHSEGTAIKVSNK